MVDHTAAFAVPSVGDLLEMLPLDVVGANVWQPLRRVDRRQLRLVNRQLCHLSDLLITRATHNLDPNMRVRTGRGRRPGGLARKPVFHFQPPDSSTAAIALQEVRGRVHEAWQLTQEQHSAFLLRLEQLRSLELVGWAAEAHLLRVLLGYSPALGGRVTALVLTCGQHSAAAGRAVRATFPALRELTVRPGRTPEDVAVYTALHDDMFRPFCDTSIAKLDIAECFISCNAISALSGMSRLQHLDFTIAVRTEAELPELSRQLRLLARLPALTHLRASCPRGAEVSLCDVSALFTLTQLTALHLPSLRLTHKGGGGPGAGVLAALAHLGAMSRLQSLQLSDFFRVRDAAFSALARLPQLTELSAHSIRVSRPAPGHLPHLQQLCLARGLTPAQLLHTLLPLLPLPQLSALHFGSIEDHVSTLPLHLLADDVADDDLSDEEGQDAGHAPVPAAAPAAAPCDDPGGTFSRRAAQFRQVAAHLAAAPHLRVQSTSVSMRVLGPNDRPLLTQLRLSLLAHSLQPLAGHLGAISFCWWRLCGRDWAAVAAALPNLSGVSLTACRCEASDLVGMAEQLPGLQRLTLYDSAGAFTPADWQQLRSGCPRPLHLSVLPPQEAAPSHLLAGCGVPQQGACA